MMFDWLSFVMGLIVGAAIAVTPYLFFRVRQNVIKEQKLIFDTNRQHIDDRVREMSTAIDKLKDQISEFEKERSTKLGQLGSEITQLSSSTGKITSLLNNSQKRGAWGERLAEDILQAVGFEENVNYTKQKTISHGRPDFTFILPDNRKLHMDVKFSLDSYQSYLDAEAETDKDKYRKEFIKTVGKTIKDVSCREYIDDDTLDFVLVFIPNEAVYRFIHEYGEGIIDKALSQKVVLCSPLTLYSTLLIVRQASRNFKLEASSKTILQALNELKSEWKKYCEKTEDLRKGLEKAQDSFDDLVGVRTQKLDKAFHQIDSLLTENGIQSSEETVL